MKPQTQTEEHMNASNASKLCKVSNTGYSITENAVLTREVGCDRQGNALYSEYWLGKRVYVRVRTLSQMEGR